MNEINDNGPDVTLLEVAKLVVFGLVAVWVAMAMACSSASADGVDAGGEPILVRAASVERRDAAEPLHANGLIAAKDELPLAFKVGGLIRRVLVDSGQSVKAGQLLATIDTAEIDAQVSQARDALAKAERDLERVGTLYEERALPLQARQDAETSRDVARATLRAAEFNRRYSAITAPDDGRVLRRHHDPDELVQAGMPIFDFASARRGFVVRTAIADRDVVRIAEGDPAFVHLAAYPDRELAATVSEIAGAARENVGTFDVELRIGDDAPRLLTGMSAAVRITPSARRPLAFVPVEAFLEGDADRGSVFALVGDSVHRVPVRVDFIDDRQIAIAAGLDGVERVVTDGAYYLRDGARVRLAD